MTQELEQRVSRVEFAIEAQASAIPDIRDSLKAIQQTLNESQKTQAAIAEFNTHTISRINKHGEVLDTIVPEVTKLRSGFDSHDWIIKRIGGAVIVALVGAVALLFKGQ